MNSPLLSAFVLLVLALFHQCNAQFLPQFFVPGRPLRPNIGGIQAHNRPTIISNAPLLELMKLNDDRIISLFVNSTTKSLEEEEEELNNSEGSTAVEEGPVGRQAPPTAQCDGTKTIQCNSCNNFWVCAGEGQSLTEASCPYDRPYCNPGPKDDICMATQNDGLCPNASIFRCTSAGYFPNPTNCRRYFICSRQVDDQLVATDYICPDGYVFDLSAKLCRLQILASECIRREIDCGIVPPLPLTRFRIYSPRPQFYYFCTNNVTEPAVMFRCPTGSEFDEANMECRYRCRRPGNYAYSDNPRRYFVCYWESFRLRSRVEECPMGFIFSQATFRCEVLLGGTPTW